MTAVSLCRVFPGWDFLGQMVLIVLVAHACAALAGSVCHRGDRGPVRTGDRHDPRLPRGVYPGTHWLGLPTRSTVSLARATLAEAWTQVGVVVPPVSESGGFGLAAALALGSQSVASDAFAFRAHGRVEALVPSGVVFVWPSPPWGSTADVWR